MKIVTMMMVLTLVFLDGCSYREGFFSEDVLHESAMIHSQKGEMYNSLEMKASIVATYLNSTVIECQKNEGEVFLVAIFIDEDSSDESKQGLLNPTFYLTLNGEVPIEFHALAYDDDLIKIAPFRNRWSTYYKVIFKTSSAKKLKMEYGHTNYGKVILSFSKEFQDSCQSQVR